MATKAEAFLDATEAPTSAPKAKEYAGISADNFLDAPDEPIQATPAPSSMVPITSAGPVQDAASFLDAPSNDPLVATDRSGRPLDPAKAGFAPEGTDPSSPASRWNADSSPYKVTSGGLELDPLRYGAGVSTAYNDGLLDQSTYEKLTANAPKIEEAARKRRDIELSAGSSPEGKAILQGLGRGGAVTLGFTAGAALPGLAGLPGGPAALVTGAAGGIVGGFAAGKAYDATYKALADNDSEFNSYLSASEARPGYNALGELASIAVTAPIAPLNLVKGIQLVRETKGALEAAKFAGKVVGIGAGTGAATDVAWKLGDQAIARFATGDETPEGPSFQGALQSAAMGALLSGLTVQNKRYELSDIQGLVTKSQAGERLNAMDQEAVSTALRVAESVKGEFPNARPTDLSMRQTSFMGQPEAISAKVTMGEGGVESRGSRVESLPGQPGQPSSPATVPAAGLPAPSPLPLENIPTGGFTMDRNNAAPANVPEGVIAMPGRAALGEGSLSQSVATSAEAFLDDAPAVVNTRTESTVNRSMYPVVEAPISEITLSEDVPNFKSEASTSTGVVQGNQLQGSYNRLGTGNIVLWQRSNGALEVISGRHRFDLAKRTGEKTIPAQVVQESQGFNIDDAMTLDAELNIRDGQGTVQDYASYFKNAPVTEQEALQGGLLSRVKGRSGWALGRSASNDLYAAFSAGRISEAKAVAIAQAAPGDEESQRAGLAQARTASMTPEALGTLVSMVKYSKAQGTQEDLFGTSDAGVNEALRLVKLANSKADEIQDQITAVRAAARRPEAAAKLGVNVSDPEGILKRVVELQAKADQYRKFYLYPEIKAELTGVFTPPAESQAAPTIATNGEGNLFGEASMPFNLSGQVETGPTPAEIAAAEAERLAQEEADRNQGDMFSDGSGGFGGNADFGPQSPGGSRGNSGNSAAEAGPSVPDNAAMVTRGPGWEMPEVLGATDRVLPIEVPELIRWFREATGFSPSLRRSSRALGMFTGIGKGRIWIRTELFANPQSVAMTLAHEIGHWIDYLPDESLKRGNILGRLATLSKFRANILSDVEGTNKEIRAELVALSDWWKPFGADTADKKSSYYKYRVSAKELYADAISVLFNSPADLELRAPKFWKAFFDLVDRKAEVANAISGIQTFLAKGPEAVNSARMSEQKAGYAKARELVKRRAASMKAWSSSPMRLWERMKDSYYFYASPAIELMHAKRAAGVQLKPEDRMDWLFEEMPLANSSVQADLMEITAKVTPLLQAVGLSDDDLGIYLENFRIANERIEVEKQLGKASEQESEVVVTGRTVMANPDGKYPAMAQALLDQQRSEMTPEAWSALQAAAQAFHDKIFSVVEAAVDAGIISRETFDTLLVPNRDVYATFTPLKYADRYVPAAIVKQVGTLDQVANPFTQSVLKMAAMRRAAQSNKAKATFFGWMRDSFPGMIRDAEMRWDGRRNVPVKTNDVGWSTVNYRVDGKLRAVHLPERYAAMFESMSPAHQDGLTQALSMAWSSLAYPLIIKYNPSFQLALSPMRDLLRTMRNAPNKTRGKLLGEMAYQIGLAALQPQGRAALATTAGGVIGQAVGSIGGFVAGPAAALAAGQVGSYVGAAAGMAVGKILSLIPIQVGSSPIVDRITGGSDALLQEMLLNGAVVGPHESFYVTPNAEGALGDILRQFNMLPAEDQPAFTRKWFMKPVMEYLRAVQFAGQIMEGLPKVAGYKVLAKDLGWGGREAGAYVRNYLGVPNYMKKGNAISTPGVLFPFINITMRSWESSMKLLAGREKGRKSQADYILSYILAGGFLTTVMMVLAREGMFGEELQKLTSKIPERDVYAYHSVPIGSTTTGDYGGKTAYVRWPVDEVDRAVNGMVYYGLTATIRKSKGEKTGLGISNVLAVAGSETPSLNPFISLPAKWATYLAGGNPLDEQRGRPILTDDEQKAGGWPAVKRLLIHSSDKIGLGNFLRYDEKSNTVSEFALSSTAPINRLLKISDAGAAELSRDEMAGEDKAISQVRVNLSEDVRTATKEYAWLQKLDTLRTPQQTLRYTILKQWYGSIYRPQIEAMRSSVERGNLDAGARAVSTINGITDGMKRSWARQK